MSHQPQNDESQASAYIYYDRYDPFLFDVRDELEKALQPLEVQTRQYMAGVSPILPTLEIVLKFVNTPIAVAILTKIVDVIYDLLQAKFAKSKQEKEDLVRTITTIVTNNITIQGVVDFNDSETVARAMKAMPQMLIEASEMQQVETKQAVQNGPINESYGISYRDGDNLTISRSTLQFRYTYSSKANRWIPTSIHKEQ